MAAKYWYVAGNGNGSWGTAANWYNGPGGTLGTTTAPTAADDVFVNAASGSGTLTISAAATCQSLDFTGFTGTLAGSSGLSVATSLTFGSIMSLIYTGTITFSGSGNMFCNGKTLQGNVIFNGTGATFNTYSLKTTGSITLITGTLNTYNTDVGGIYGLECNNFVSNSTLTRAFWNSSTDKNNFWNITGNGTVWNVAATGLTCYDTVNNMPVGNLYFSDSSASTKTIANSLTGNNVPLNTYFSGSGSGIFQSSGTLSLYNLYVTNTGAGSMVGTYTLQGNLDFGISNIILNTAGAAMTLAGVANSVTLSPNMTITSSSAITVTGNYYFTSNGKTFTSNITCNSASGGIFPTDTLRCSATLTLTAGVIQITDGSGDLYTGAFSSSNTNSRTIYCGNLYLTGTGTLQTLNTATNLTYNVQNVYVTDSSATAKTLSFPVAIAYTGNIYLGGSGSGSITLAVSTGGSPIVYVTNTGGAAVSFSTGVIRNLTFVTGTNAIWSNAAVQTLTIVQNLSIASSAGTPTLTPSIILTAGGTFQTPIPVTVSLGGKSLVTGTVTINDLYGAVQTGSSVTFTDAFSSNAAFAVTSVGSFTFNSTCTCTTISITGIASIGLFSSNITTLSTISITSANTINFNDINASGAITLNNASLTCNMNGTVTGSALTISNGVLNLRGNTTLSGVLTLTTGTLQTFTNNITSSGFASTGTTVRTLTLGSGIWTLTGTGTLWNLVSTNMSFTGGTMMINITDTSATTVAFIGGSLSYYTLQFNRGGGTGSNGIASGNNTFVNLFDLGTAAHTLTFIQGNTQTIGNFVVNGSPGNLVTITSANNINGFNLIKSPLGLVSCDYLNIQHSIVTPANTWYAGANSVNNQAVATLGSGWIFAPPPARKLGSGGVG